MFLDVPGAQRYASRSGPASGQSTLAIGGWIGSSELWQEPPAILSDDHAVVSYEHRGTGFSVSIARCDHVRESRRRRAG